MKAYYPRTRKMHFDVTFDEKTGFVTRNHGQKMRASKLVLLPEVGVLDAAGAPIHLGDIFTRFHDGVEESFIVGPLPAAGVLVKSFELVGYARKSNRKVPGHAQSLPLTAEVVVGLRHGGNVYANPELVVPEKTFYCYKPLSWKDGVLSIVTCPFYESSDHGMVYCRLRQWGSLTDEAGARSDALRAKALAHFGSEEAVEAVDTVGLLWDQVKCCGISHEPPDDDDFEDDVDEA